MKNYKIVFYIQLIAYDKKENKIEIVTIHPISEEKIINRLLGKRWLKK